jgi:hypothetical protein
MAACGGGGGDTGSNTADSGDSGNPPTPVTYSVAGTISGLSASGLQIIMGSETLSINANASTFELTAELADGENYSVSVTQQPAGLECLFVNSVGVIAGADAALELNCASTAVNVSVSVAGLLNGSVNLTLNSSETIDIAANAGPFTFSQALLPGANYALELTLPSAAADKPKALCHLPVSSGVVGSTDVNVNMICRNLDVVDALVSGVDSPLVALDADSNVSADFGIGWLEFDATNNNFKTSTFDNGVDAWNAEVSSGNSAGASDTNQTSSVFLDDSKMGSLFYFKDLDLGGGAWNSQLTEQVLGGVSNNLSTADATVGETSKLASVATSLGGQRVKLLAVDNNNQAQPICIYRQQTDSPSSKMFCITASAAIQADGGSVDDITLAIHVNEDGATGRGIVVWQQIGTLNAKSVGRLHGALFDLDGGNVVTEVLAGETTPSADYSYTNPAVVSISTDSKIGFALTYELEEEQVRLETLSDSLVQTSVASVTAGGSPVIDIVRAPSLVSMSSNDLRWTYITEDRSAIISSLLNASSLVTWRLRFQENQSPLYNPSIDDAHIFGSASGFRISHFAAAVDEQDNTIIVFRESKRSTGTEVRSVVANVVLDHEVTRLQVISGKGDSYSLSDSLGVIDSQLYDDDPNNGSDTRAPLAFTKDDAVLDIALSDNGEAVIAWSQWQQADDRNALKTVRLALP